MRSNACTRRRRGEYEGHKFPSVSWGRMHRTAGRSGGGERKSERANFNYFRRINQIEETCSDTVLQFSNFQPSQKAPTLSRIIIWTTDESNFHTQRQTIVRQSWKRERLWKRSESIEQCHFGKVTFYSTSYSYVHMYMCAVYLYSYMRACCWIVEQ